MVKEVVMYIHVPKNYTGLTIDLLGNTSHVENGVLHRDGYPAVYGGNIEGWYNHGVLHRADGPALTYTQTGDFFYYYKGVKYNDISSDEEWNRFVAIQLLK